MLKTKIYNCTQQELYAVCNSIWDSCLQELPKFTALSPRYNEAYVVERKQEVFDCSKRPDWFQRSATQNIKRFSLQSESENCLDTWRRLKRFIQLQWKGEDQKSRLKMAGLPYYREATQSKWESCMALMSNGLEFIRANAAALSENNVMPTDFIQEFELRHNTYSALLLAHTNSGKESSAETAAKLDANNSIYKYVQELIADAKILFRGDKVKLKHFNFDAILLAFSGPGTAGIKGSISNGHALTEPIAGLQLSLLESKTEVDIEDDNSFRFFRLSTGVYTLEIKAPGYKAVDPMKVEVKTGVYTTVNIELVEER